jgi:hypothetical protein
MCPLPRQELDVLLEKTRIMLPVKVNAHGEVQKSSTALSKFCTLVLVF